MSHISHVYPARYTAHNYPNHPDSLLIHPPVTRLRNTSPSGLALVASNIDKFNETLDLPAPPWSDVIAIARRGLSSASSAPLRATLTDRPALAAGVVRISYPTAVILTIPPALWAEFGDASLRRRYVLSFDQLPSSSPAKWSRISLSDFLLCLRSSIRSSRPKTSSP